MLFSGNCHPIRISSHWGSRGDPRGAELASRAIYRSTILKTSPVHTSQRVKLNVKLQSWKAFQVGQGSETRL